MLIKVLRPSLLVLMFVTLISIMGIVGTYLVLKPTLPEINLVDEDILQIPLKVFSSFIFISSDCVTKSTVWDF